MFKAGEISKEKQIQWTYNDSNQSSKNDEDPNITRMTTTYLNDTTNDGDDEISSNLPRDEFVITLQ